MKRIYAILVVVLSAFVLSVRVQAFAAGQVANAQEIPATAISEEAESQGGENPVDVKGIVFGHIGDSYEWHITTWGDVHVTIPLPVTFTEPPLLTSKALLSCSFS